MNNFEFAIDLILDLEGGFVDHPLDRGGPTKYGITLNTISAHRNRPVSVQEVRDLSRAEAGEIYLAQFWNPVRLGRIQSKKIALIVFSHVVHTGPLSAIKAVQKTLNVHFGQMLFIDGVFGTRTEIALNGIQDHAAFCRKLLQTIQTYYVEICEARRDQSVFLKGWMNRSHQVWNAVAV